MEAEPLLRVEDLKVHFPITAGLLARREIGRVRAVDGVSLTVAAGETLGLVGESGCGKSTTGLAILRMQPVTGGRIVFEGTDITHTSQNDLRPVRRRMQMVYQDPYGSLNPRMTVADIVAEPLVVHNVGDRASRRDRTAALLDLVGLRPEMASRYPHEFSGGQRQRIGIARALALEPALLICDEPVSALDVSIQAQVVNLLAGLQARLGLSMIFIAHDLAVVRHVSDRIAVMYLGRIVEVATRDQLHARPLHPYTRALLAAIPIPSPAIEAARERIVVTGEVPSALNPPSGCRFHTRCPNAMERCRVEDPAPTTMEDGQVVSCHLYG